MGYAKIDDRVSGGKLVEYDTCACRHCSAVIKIVKRQPQGAYCMPCGGPVCNRAPCNTRCRPMEQRVERFKRVVEQQRRSTAFAQAAGLQMR